MGRAYPWHLKVARSAGFCPGVAAAVRRAEALTAKTKTPLYMYGEIVHNEWVIDELLDKGFTLIHSPEEATPGLALIRAHGITLEEERALQERDVQLVDCTCIWVKKIHELAHFAKQAHKTLIFCGSAGHPEVEGILSRAGKDTILIAEPEEAESLTDEGKDYVLAAQTTFSYERFHKIKNILKRKMSSLQIFDTICSTTADRQQEAADLSAWADIMLVLGSGLSSNTHKLFQICQKRCSQTYLIQRPEQVRKLFKLSNLRQMRIGITAGASTPERVIREVIKLMTEQDNFSTQQEDKTMEVAENPEVKVENEEAMPTDPQNNAGIDQAETVAAEEENQADAAVTEATETTEEENADSHEDSGDFSFSDYIDQIPQLKRGAVITGNIIRYDDDFVYVDVHDKSEGKVPRREFTDDPNFDLEEACRNHETVEVYVRHIKNSDMGKEIILSKARVDFENQKKVIEQAFEEQTPVTVKVNKIVKDGVIASYGAVDLYIHRTQLELRRVDDLEPYRDQVFDVLITQFDNNHRRLRVSGSRRSFLQRDRKEKAQDVWESIEVGKEYTGVVRNLTNFGAFVDIGGVDGLVHISQLSWKRIKHPSEVLAVGDALKVFVLDYDKEHNRISLGYKREENDPYNNIESRFPQGSIVRGIVLRMFPFGAFVEIAPGVDALCHISQISNFHLNHPKDALQVGMEVDARVMAVSNEDRKISISIKEVEPIDPANKEDFVEHKPRQARGEEEGEGAEGHRRKSAPNNNRHHREEVGPTTYMDSSAGSGSSFASLANIQVESEAGAQFMESLRQEQAATEAEPVESAEAEAPAEATEAGEEENPEA